MTNPERFRALHTAMLDTLARLEREFEARREEGYGLDKELERDFTLARPTVRLTPADLRAAPITVVFSDFPGLHIRFGKWWQEPFPVCGCDACAESGEQLAEELARLVDSVIAGRFREGYAPSGCCPEGELWGPDWRRGRGFKETGIWTSRRQVHWKPWPKRAEQVD